MCEISKHYAKYTHDFLHEFQSPDRGFVYLELEWKKKKRSFFSFPQETPKYILPRHGLPTVTDDPLQGVYTAFYIDFTYLLGEKYVYVMDGSLYSIETNSCMNGFIIQSLIANGYTSPYLEAFAIQLLIPLANLGF